MPIRCVMRTFSHNRGVVQLHTKDEKAWSANSEEDVRPSKINSNTSEIRLSSTTSDHKAGILPLYNVNNRRASFSIKQRAALEMSNIKENTCMVH